MRWPVSAARVDAIVARWQAELAGETRRADEQTKRAAEWNEAYRLAHVRYDELLDKYHALKLAGGAAPLPVAPKAVPDIVSQAVIIRSKNSIGLRKHYAEYVTLERAKGTSDAEIAKAILEGHSSDDEGVA